MSRAAANFATLATFAALSVLSISHIPQAVAGSHGSISVSGSPATTVAVGTAYAFSPSVTPASAYERFSISNKPAWATFNRYTGLLSGTPTAAGTFANIQIS